MISVTKETYPHLHAAFKSIECDNGGHLIGTVYPGTPIDLNRFLVPEAWSHLISGAELGLKRLTIKSGEDLETFVNGEQSEAEVIELRQGDLTEARILLNDFFNGWPSEDAPYNQTPKSE